MVGRSVSPRLFAGIVFSTIQLLILVVGFTYQADAEARCRGGSCRAARIPVFQPFRQFQPVQRFQPMQSCSGRSCGQPVMSSCGARGCGQPASSCGMRQVCNGSSCRMVSSCGGGGGMSCSGGACGQPVGQACSGGACRQLGGQACSGGACSQLGGQACSGGACNQLGGQSCSGGACRTQQLNGISPAHASAANLLGIGNEALSRGVSSGLGALQDQGTVQGCGGGVNWYNRSRGGWEPANICLSVNNQQLPIILNAQGELQLADQTGNLEPLSDNHARALAATYRKNGVKHDFMPALFQRFPEETASTAVAQTESAAPQPTAQAERTPASALSETASAQSQPTPAGIRLIDAVIKNGNKLDGPRAAAETMKYKDQIRSAIQQQGKGDTLLMFSGFNCVPCGTLKKALTAVRENRATPAQLDFLKSWKIDPSWNKTIISIDLGATSQPGFDPQFARELEAAAFEKVPFFYGLSSPSDEVYKDKE